MRRCSECKIEKDINNYYKDKSRKKHNTHADVISASYYKTVIEWIQEHHLSRIVTYL